MNRFGACDGPHRRLRIEARRSLLIQTLNGLYPLLLRALVLLVANLITIPASTFVTLAFAFALSSLLSAATIFFHIPISLGLVLAKTFSLWALGGYVAR